MARIDMPIEGTEATDALCKEIARKSNGVAFLGFSGGKDSLCAYLNLRRFFKRIIPFHCAAWPGVRHIREYLDYVEYETGGVHILRMNGEDYPMAASRMIYQPFKDCIEIEDWDIPTYSKLDVLEYLRYRYALPKAWCAFGIAACESIDRAIYVKKIEGRNPQNRTFYPCYDWSRKQILDTVEQSGIKLPSSYRYVNRTIGHVPGIVTNEILKRHYPEDWKRVLALYPLAEAKTVREQILDREWLRRRNEVIVANGGEASADVSANDEDTELYEGDWMEDSGSEG